MNSRRAGMQGSEPTQWLSQTTERSASRAIFGVRTQSVPYGSR